VRADLRWPGPRATDPAGRPGHPGAGLEDGLPLQRGADQRRVHSGIFSGAPVGVSARAATDARGRRVELMSLEVLILLVVFVGLLLLNVPVAVCIGLATAATVA